MFLHSVEPAGVLGAAGGGDAVPMPEPVDDVHHMVVDEVEADGRDLGERTSSEEEGQALQWLELFRSPCGFVSKPRTRAMFWVEVRCIAYGRAR